MPGAEQAIRFQGQVVDVEQWMCGADIVVRPSFTEGLPLAVLEAMSAGRCNVVSDIAPNLELISEGVTGATFRTGDAADLSSVLDGLIADPARRSRLARQGQDSSRLRSWDKMAAETGRFLVDASSRRS